MKMDHRATHAQTQTLTPRMQQAVRLLQLSALDYEHELTEMTARNPFLDMEEAAHAPPASPATHAPDRAEMAATSDDTAQPHADDYSEWAPDAGGQGSTPMRTSHQDRDFDALDAMAQPENLRHKLLGQAHLLPVSARDHALVCLVIESLEDDGYLRCELTELAELADLDPPADLQELNTALQLVQSFEPSGVGARTVTECLGRQLDAVPPEHRELTRVILADHIGRLERRDLSGIAAATGRTRAEVEAACRAMRSLDPRPGLRHGATQHQHVTPDVIVRRVRGTWTAQLNPAVKPRLSLNRRCAELFQHGRDGGHSELTRHLQEARWALRNVELRFSTILEVSRAILKRQQLFFEYGPPAMKPLALREIAQEVGVHESTVCRVTNNKYMATPAGLFELKHFFSRAMPVVGGGASTGTAIRSVVKELIEGEDVREPLSDVAIAQRLAREGLHVARRNGHEVPASDADRARRTPTDGWRPRMSGAPTRRVELEGGHHFGASPLRSFWMGGFEGADHVTGDGTALDMVAAHGHLDQLEADHERAASLGLRTVRESIGWRLAEPEVGVHDLARLLRVARSARRHGLQVLWTLMHYGVPADLTLFDPALGRRFAAFAGAVARALADELDAPAVFNPINEISFLAWGATSTHLFQGGASAAGDGDGSSRPLRIRAEATPGARVARCHRGDPAGPP